MSHAFLLSRTGWRVCALAAGAILHTVAVAQGPSAVPPNASRVTATVIARKVWPPGSLENVRPLVPAQKTFCSLELKILAAEPANHSDGHLAEVGATLEAFSSESIASDIVGKKITACLSLTGDTSGVRWALQNFHLLP